MGFLGTALGVAGAVGSLFGGGDKPSGSSNQAFDQLQSTYTPQTQTGVQSNNYMAGLLGVPGGDTAGADAGFQSYLDKAGYAPALQRLQSGITQGAASKGLLNSGSTQKALVKYGSDLNQQYYNNYFQNLNTLNQRGLDAGQTIGSAGSTSTEGEQEGWASKLGSVGSALGSIFA